MTTPSDLTDRQRGPRLIRVVSGIMSCPVCGRNCLHSVIQAGWAFQSCGQHKAGGDTQANTRQQFGRPDRWKGRCDAEWWTLAIPPDAPAGHLCAIMGEDLARLILARAYPAAMSTEEPERWGVILNPSDQQAWIQIAVKPRERHLYRTAKLSQLLTTFLAA